MLSSSSSSRSFSLATRFGLGVTRQAPLWRHDQHLLPLSSLAWERRPLLQQQQQQQQRRHPLLGLLPPGTTMAATRATMMMAPFSAAATNSGIGGIKWRRSREGKVVDEVPTETTGSEAGGQQQQQQQPGQQDPNKDDGEVSAETRKRLSRAGMLGTGLIILAGKTKWVFAALKLTKMSTMLSMLATTGAYALFFGWPFAAGFVGLILVHESGHALAMKYYGIDASPMVFIPFMGAAIEMRSRPKDVEQEAMVAIAGPVLGSIGALAVGLVGIQMQSQLLITLADAGLMINAFNLLPIGQLDGGRIAGAVSPYALVGGLGIGGYLIATGSIHSPIFYLVMLLGVFQAYERFFGDAVLDPSYYRISRGKRIFIGASYVGLIAAILASIAFLQPYRKSPKQLREEEAARRQREEPIPNSSTYLEPETVFERFAKQIDAEEDDFSKQNGETFKDPWATNSNPPINHHPPTRWA